MSTPKHTPGPWREVPRKDDLVNIYAGNTDVALCVRPKDARLIAAAPELRALVEATALALNRFGGRIARHLVTYQANNATKAAFGLLADDLRAVEVELRQMLARIDGKED